MTQIVYDVYDDLDDLEEDPEDVKEDFFAVISLFVGAILFVLLLAAIWVLRWDTKYSLYCGHILNPTRVLSRAFWMRLAIVMIATVVLNFKADAITLSLYFGILYCTIFHDLFFRRDCPPDMIDKVTTVAKEAYEAGKQIAAQGAAAVSSGYQMLVEKSTQLAEQIGEKIGETKSYLQQHGHELTHAARSTLVNQLKFLEESLVNMSQALASQSEEVLRAAVEQADAAYQTTYAFLGQIISGILKYFVGPQASSLRSDEGYRVGSFFERADQEVADLFERAEQEAKKRKRADMRAEGGGLELTDVTVGERLQLWFGGKDDQDILDQRLAKELGVSDVKDLPADLPKMLVNEYATPDMDYDAVQQKWVPIPIRRSRSRSRSNPGTPKRNSPDVMDALD